MSESKSYPILSQINDPRDLKALDAKSLPLLCGEIREFLVDNVSKTGGHLASNLGVVELSVALHRVFETPKDHIIFDVGHQSYVHKILTGRRENFDTLRQKGGISGFAKTSESCHDAFGTGHSSTSVSAALGFAEADRISGSDAYSIAVLGDGAFTGGMVHEAFNNCRRSLKLIIILNENEMSISKNTGRFADNLSKLRLSRGYFNTKNATSKILSGIPFLGSRVLKLLKRIKRFAKNAVYGSNYFENMGLYYLGPVDGNDIDAMVECLELAKKQSDSVLIHVKTQKGKGYEPAERFPDKYHSMSPVGNVSDSSFSEEFGKFLAAEAEKNEDIVAITAAMCDGTGLVDFREKFSTRFFDVGIAESHAITFASGLAAGGKRPVAAIYSTFLQRAYDNIIHDVALQRLPVCLAIDRAGINSADGPTHHGIFDVAFLSEIPNVRIYTPATYEAMKLAFREALSGDFPSAVRYPRGAESSLIKEHFYKDETSGVGIKVDFKSDEKLDAVIITHGRIAEEAIKAQSTIADKGARVGIILLEMLKPYSVSCELIARAIGERECPLITLEEEIRNGGAGMLIRDELQRNFNYNSNRFAILAIDDNFAFDGGKEDLYKSLGISAENVENEILKIIGKA